MAEKSAKLKVDGLSTSITESHLYTVLVNKKRKGGGPIDNIQLITNGETNYAIVTFEESEAVDLILSRGDTLEIKDVTVNVQRYLESRERKSSFTPPRNAPNNSGTSKVGHSSHDAYASKKKSSKAKSEKDDSEQNSDIDDLSETQKNRKGLGKRTSSVPSEKAKLHRKRSTNISQSTGDEQDETVDDSSSSESPPVKSKNVKDKFVKTSSTKKEEPLASKTCSVQNKQPKTQRRKSNTQTRTSDSKHISDNNDLSGSDSSPEKPKYSARKSNKAPAEVRKPSVAKNPSSSDEDSVDDEESRELWEVTIKAKVKELGKSKDFYIYYFEDKKICQGPFYEESLMLDALNRNLYLTFHTRKAALATVCLKHQPESNLLKVEMATEEDFDTHANLLSVHGQNCHTDQQRKALMEAVAEQTKMKVVNIIHQDEPRSAIIVFDPHTCSDVSAATWTRLVVNKVYLILAPVFKTKCVKVRNLHTLSSDDTLKRYLSSDRSCGGEVTYFQRQSPKEALVIFKEEKDFDGFLGKSEHMIDHCMLDVKAYYQCLSPEAYKLISQLVIELNNVTLVNKSCHGHNPGVQGHNPGVQVPMVQGHHSGVQVPMVQGHHSGVQVPMVQGHHSGVQVPLVQKSSSLHTLSCTFGQVYTSVNSSMSKTVQYNIQLCKFGTDFLTRSQHLQELLRAHHCKHTFLPHEGNGCIVLMLDFPAKIKMKEVRKMLDSGRNALCEYLDTFIVAKCYINKSYIHDFQKFCQEKCQQEKPIVEAFFDHTDNSAIFFSDRDEAGLKDCVNTMYNNFMSHIPKFEGAAIKTPLAKSETFPIPKARKNNKQHSVHKENNDKDRKEVIEKPKFSEEQKLKLEEEDIILFQKTNFHKEVEKNNQPMEITFDLDTNDVIIKGIKRDSINCAQTELLKKAREFHRLSMSSLFSPEQLQLLNKKDVQDRINKVFEEKGHHARFQCNTDDAILFYVGDNVGTFLKDIIKSHVVIKTKTIDSDMSFILKSQKGQKFLSDLCESTDGVRMSSLVNLQEKCLQIISSSQNVDALMNLVDQFAEENKSYEKKIQFSSGKQLYLKKYLSIKLSKLTESLTTLGAKIIYNAESITVQGLKEGVNLGETQLSNLSELILVQEITLKYFGIKEFLQTTEGKSLLPSVEKNNSCIVTLPTTEAQAKPSGASKAFQGIQAPPSRQPNLIAHVTVGECSFLFMQGDITSLSTDAIVNPIDSTLKCQTGLGKALVLRGGHRIQADLASHNMQGNPGDVAETSAGNLDTCKRVVHVVCPVYTGTDEEEVITLDVAIKACIKHAENQGIQSLAIPAMGTGKMFKFPRLVACKLLMKSLHKLVTASTSKLTKVFLCDTQADNVKELIERFKNIFGVSVDEVGDLEDKPTRAPGPAVPPKPVIVKKTPKTFRNIKVNLITGEITKQKTDVIVVTVGKSLELSKGGITKDIVTYGGDSVQQELLDNFSPEIQPGDLGTTSGGNLNCTNIYYARLNHWRGKEEDHMQKLVYKMLLSADQQSAASISIPALGTGRLGYPPNIAADAIINAISQFDKDNAKSSLKLVNLVVYKTDANVKQAFETALSGGGGPKGAEGETSGHVTSKFVHAMRKAAMGDKSHIKKFNSVKLKITKGDITAEKCDAIISGIRDSLDMSNSGAVCKALLKQCGSALQDECSAKNTEMAQKGFIATSAPNLNCNQIYHVSMDRFSRSWDRCISQVLTEAESQGHTSIALPALGSGARNADYQQIKQKIFSGVNYFSRSSKGVLTDVRLVVYSQEILDAFLSEDDSPKHAPHSNNGAEATPTQSLAKVSEHVDLKVYAENHPKIASATKELNTVFTNAVKEEKEKNKEYKQLNKHQVRQLEMEGMNHCVKVSISLDEGVIKMKSFRAEGFVPVLKLTNTLIVAAVKDHHKSLQQAVEATIQWQFDQHGKWRSFEPIVNSELEKEYKNKSKHHDITDSRDHTYRIDFGQMKEFPLDENGKISSRHSINVRRHDRTKEGEPLPKKWESMGDTDNLKLVPLQAGGQEYKHAEALFIQGGANLPIKKIERIQNKSLYQQYKAKKRELDNRNPKGHVNERNLFHGTDSDSVTAINKNGFNRSYCGKNATAYGNGVYFAVNSSYSVNYAHQSAQGERHMYIARVLTGVSTPSRSGMTHLPNRPGTDIPYDSGSASEIFIIFHDSHAYPEYLITF